MKKKMLITGSIALGLLVLFLVTPILFWLVRKAWGVCGVLDCLKCVQVFDTYATAVGVLFTGFAFAGLIVTIWMQNKQIQIDKLKATEELFFSNLKLIGEIISSLKIKAYKKEIVYSSFEAIEKISINIKDACVAINKSENISAKIYNIQTAHSYIYQLPFFVNYVCNKSLELPPDKAVEKINIIRAFIKDESWKICLLFMYCDGYLKLKDKKIHQLSFEFLLEFIPDENKEAFIVMFKILMEYSIAEHPNKQLLGTIIRKHYNPKTSHAQQ